MGRNNQYIDDSYFGANTDMANTEQNNYSAKTRLLHHGSTFLCGHDRIIRVYSTSKTKKTSD